MDMQRKLMPVEVRELGDRQLEIAGSTEDVDRMGDVIKAKGWQLGAFKDNPIFLWGHDYNMPPIGRATRVWVDKATKRLMFNIEFADAETYAFADTIYKLYKGGFLHATSVGFIPLDWEGKDDENPYPKFEGNVFTSQELLELSGVTVPANANALVTARDQGLITVKEMESVTASIEVADDAEALPFAEPPEADDEPADEDAVDDAKPVPAEVSQAQLGDDIDHVQKTIEIVGLNGDTLSLALGLAVEIMERTAGDDMPENILAKIGAVLNAKNKGRLSQIQELAQAVLDSAEKTDDSEKAMEPDEATPDPAEAKRQRALEIAEVAQVVIARLQGKRQY